MKRTSFSIHTEEKINDFLSRYIIPIKSVKEKIMNIRPAYKHVDDIQEFLYLNQHNKKYENLFINNWLDVLTLSPDTFHNISWCFYVKDKLVGWLFIETIRPTNVLNISNFCVIDEKYTVGIFRKSLELIKAKVTKRTPKVTFQTMVGSYADGIWRKAIKKYNGEIIGIRKNHFLDQKENYRDCVVFEIHNPEFTYM